MALDIHWSKRADKRFDKILKYLLEEWGEKVTRSFVRKVYDFLDILSEFHEISTIMERMKKFFNLAFKFWFRSFFRRICEKVTFSALASTSA
jgi:plasmid stabilization system protein ParE